MRAGKPRGPTLVSIFMHALIVARASHVRDKAAAPGLTFPIMTKGGGVCACEASAGGRVSRFGKAVYPRENRPATRRCRAIGYRDPTTGRPHLRPGRAVDMRSPHTEPGREVWGYCPQLTSRRVHLRPGDPRTVRMCQDEHPRAQRGQRAILGACHVTRAQRHTRVF